MPFNFWSTIEHKQGPSPAQEKVTVGNQTTDRREETADSRIPSANDQLKSLVDVGESLSEVLSQLVLGGY